MEKLGSRLVEQHVTSLSDAVAQRVTEDELDTEDLTAIIEWLKRIGLVDLGRLRSRFLFRDQVYEPDTKIGRHLVADLLHALGAIERLSGAQARLSTDGVVEFVRDGRVVSAFVVVSGCGSRGRVAMENLINGRLRELRSRSVVPQGALIGGSPGWEERISPPVDIAIDDPAASIVTSASSPLLVTVEDIRATRVTVDEIAP
jgi:hypothetical protein